LTVGAVRIVAVHHAARLSVPNEFLRRLGNRFLGLPVPRDGFKSPFPEAYSAYTRVTRSYVPPDARTQRIYSKNSADGPYRFC